MKFLIDAIDPKAALRECRREMRLPLLTERTLIFILTIVVKPVWERKTISMCLGLFFGCDGA